jgi:hypothetical protein
LRFFTELGFHLAPTHGALIDKLGGHMDGFPPLPYRVWLDQAERIWQALSSEEMPFPADVDAYAQLLYRHGLRAHDRMMLPNYRDEVSRLSAGRAGREELEDQFEPDRVELDRLGTAVGWQEELESATKERS